MNALENATFIGFSSTCIQQLAPPSAPSRSCSVVSGALWQMTCLLGDSKPACGQIRQLPEKLLVHFCEIEARLTEQ